MGHESARVVCQHARLEAVPETEPDLAPVGEVFVVVEEQPVVTNNCESFGRIVLRTQTFRPSNHGFSRVADESLVSVPEELPIVCLIT